MLYNNYLECKVKGKMLTQVNFGTSKKIYKDFSRNNASNRVFVEEKKDGFFRKAANGVANIQKGYIGIKDGIVGVASAVVSGLVAGAAVLGIDWTVGRLRGHGAKDQSLLLTPLKTVLGAIAGIGKKIGSVFNKSIGQIVTYPFIGMPKDIYNYVKDAKGCSKFGKVAAVGVGVVAAGLAGIGTLISVNRKFAHVDHGFKVGHNK